MHDLGKINRMFGIFSKARKILFPKAARSRNSISAMHPTGCIFWKSATGYAVSGRVWWYSGKFSQEYVDFQTTKGTVFALLSGALCIGAGLRLLSAVANALLMIINRQSNHCHFFTICLRGNFEYLETR
jgi:hypothetical protein